LTGPFDLPFHHRHLANHGRVGTFSEVTRNAAWQRMSAAGIQLVSWFAAASELHRDWRNDVEGLGTLFANHIPDYRNLIASYMTAKTPANAA
jgi:hypothetical protein